MSYAFQGTFTASQFARFQSYVQDQVQNIDARLVHLRAERARVGDLQFAYDSGGIPTGLASDPPDTYCGRLFGAYEALGGDAEFDLQIRSTSQPVYRIPGDETQAAQLMSNGEVLSVLGLSDAESSLLMQRLRGWVSDDLQRRKDSLERKIRRAIDYSEQLDLEINELVRLKGSVDQEGSLAFMLSSVETLTADGQYTAITQDNAADPHGKFARAPVASYMPGPRGAPVTTYERTTNQGLVKPTE